MVLQIIKSLGVTVISVVLFAACSEALTSHVGGEIGTETGGCENCEHCESGTELVDKQDNSKADGEEVASKDSSVEEGLENSGAKGDSREAGKEGDLKKSGEEDKTTN